MRIEGLLSKTKIYIYSVLLFLTIILLWVTNPEFLYNMSMTYGYIFIALFVIGYFAQSLFRNSINPILNKIDKYEKEVSDNPNDIQLNIELSYSRLQLYIERNLFQLRFVFWVMILILFIGFSLIVFGTIYAYMTNIENVSYIPIVGGIFNEFIAIVFFFLYKSLSLKSSEYMKILERISMVGISIQYIDSISDKSLSKKDDVKLELIRKVTKSL